MKPQYTNKTPLIVTTDNIIATLEQRDWSEQANTERLIAPARQSAREYHDDTISIIVQRSQAHEII